jgi:hypothetical protein
MLLEGGDAFRQTLGRITQNGCLVRRYIVQIFGYVEHASHLTAGPFGQVEEMRKILECLAFEILSQPVK